MQPYTASCHCGAIRFAFEAEPITRRVRCKCSFLTRVFSTGTGHGSDVGAVDLR
jgi:hypothetical protein